MWRDFSMAQDRSHHRDTEAQRKGAILRVSTTSSNEKRFQISDFRFQISDFRFQISGLFEQSIWNRNLKFIFTTEKQRIEKAILEFLCSSVTLWCNLTGISDCRFKISD